MDIELEVQPVPQWNNRHELQGYFPGIFGPTRLGNRTYMLPALGKGGALFDTPAAALAAWEHARPVDSKEEEAFAPVKSYCGWTYKMYPAGTLEEIEKRGLFRVI